MALLGESFLLVGGDRIEGVLAPVAHPLAALAIGLLATAIGQSSTATITIILALAATGGLPLSVAIPMVIGANIGTSVTSTIVAVGHVREVTGFRRALEAATLQDFFNLSAMAILLPLELAFRPLERSARAASEGVFVPEGTRFTSPFAVLVDPVVGGTLQLLAHQPVAGVAVAVAMVWLAIRLFAAGLSRRASSRRSSPLQRAAFCSAPRGFLAGAGLTALVQSSSVTTSLAVPFAGFDLIELDEVLPYVIGANVGTTLTVLIAAIAMGSTVALTLAIVHVLFNVVGGALVYPLRRIPLGLSTRCARWISASVP